MFRSVAHPGDDNDVWACSCRQWKGVRSRVTSGPFNGPPTPWISVHPRCPLVAVVETTEFGDSASLWAGCPWSEVVPGERAR